MVVRLWGLDPNVHELQLGEVTILFSYQTPISVTVDGESFTTAEKFSATTERHKTKHGRGELVSSALFKETLQIALREAGEEE